MAHTKELQKATWIIIHAVDIITMQRVFWESLYSP